MKSIFVLACLTAAALPLPAQAVYKCVDGAGKVYYSDKMNPDCGRSSELSNQGVVMPKKEAAKPAHPPKPDPAGTPPAISKEQERRDRALMATYTSEAEIDAARDRSLALPEQGTKSVESKLEKLNGKLTELKKQADTLAAQKKPLPAPLLEEVNATQRAVSGLEADLAQRKGQSDAIRARFEADKLRFRELKGPSQASQ
jgi:hypothetical protein